MQPEFTRPEFNAVTRPGLFRPADIVAVISQVGKAVIVLCRNSVVEIIVALPLGSASDREDRSKRLLPTACAKLICGPATTVKVNFKITGLLYEEITSIEQIKKDFAAAVKAVFVSAKHQGILRYNDVRPVIKGIAGVTDYGRFLDSS